MKTISRLAASFLLSAVALAAATGDIKIPQKTAAGSFTDRIFPTSASGLLATDGSGIPIVTTNIPTAVTIGGGYIYRAGGTTIPVADGGTGTATGSITGTGALTFTAGAGAATSIVGGSTGASFSVASGENGAGTFSSGGSGFWYWRFNSIISGGVTQNSGTGGLYITADGSGADASIRFVPKGAGITLFNNGQVVVSDTTEVSGTSGSVRTEGGVSVGKSIGAAGYIRNVSVKTATYQIAVTDDVVVGNHATVAFTITMIAASTNTGRQFRVFNKGAAIVTLDATGLGQINGANTLDLAQYKGVVLISDGATWTSIGN